MTNEEHILLLKWIADPVIFFRDVFRLEPYPYQAKIMRETKDLKINRIMICAAGSTGKTKLIAGIGLYGAVVLPILVNKPYRVIILGGSQKQSQIVYQYIKDAILSHKYLKSIVEGEPLQSITRFLNGSSIQALARSFKSIYGVHADCVIVDEAIEAGDFVIRDTRRIIGESPISRIILSTTPHDYNSLFVEMWLDKEKYPEYNPNKKQIGAWKRYSWSVMDCPRITSEMIEEARRNLPEWMFQVYWLGKPFPVANTMIPHEKLKIATKNNPVFEYKENKGSVIMGIDWGHEYNPTAIILVQLIDEQYYVLEFKTFLREHPDKVIDWIENIARQYKVKAIYTDSTSVEENIRLSDRGLPVFPIKFKNEKGIMQANLTRLFIQEKIKIPESYIPLIKQLRVYTYDTKTGEDLVDALMLATRSIKVESRDSIYYKFSRPRKAIYV